MYHRHSLAFAERWDRGLSASRLFLLRDTPGCWRAAAPTMQGMSLYSKLNAGWLPISRLHSHLISVLTSMKRPATSGPRRRRASGGQLLTVLHPVPPRKGFRGERELFKWFRAPEHLQRLGLVSFALLCSLFYYSELIPIDMSLNPPTFVQWPGSRRQHHQATHRRRAKAMTAERRTLEEPCHSRLPHRISG